MSMKLSLKHAPCFTMAPNKEAWPSMWSVTCFIANGIEIVVNICSSQLGTGLEVLAAMCQVVSVTILDLKSRD